MQISQGKWRSDQGLIVTDGEVTADKVNLVLYFWSADVGTATKAYEDLKKEFPNA